MSALIEQLEAEERAAEAAAAQGEPALALVHLLRAAELLVGLRGSDTAGQGEEQGYGLEQAQSLLSLAACLAREDGPHYLPGLVAVTEQFARCCQRARRLEAAAEAFAQAVDGAKLLALTGAEDEQLALAELMSAQALCLAQLGRLAEARSVGERVVELGRAALWRSLPLTIGTLAFLADLELAAGDAGAHQARLSAALELLETAEGAGQPGAGEAAAKLRARLQEAVDPGA